MRHALVNRVPVFAPRHKRGSVALQDLANGRPGAYTYGSCDECGEYRFRSKERDRDGLFRCGGCRERRSERA